MKRVFITGILSCIASIGVGLGIAKLIVSTQSLYLSSVAIWSVITMAVSYTIIINALFFFIRRWNGCIEKLGGFTFSFIIWISSLVLIWVIKDFLSTKQLESVIQLILIATAQITLIGFFSTQSLRTCNYNPNK
jgi:hypothetical protein